MLPSAWPAAGAAVTVGIAVLELSGVSGSGVSVSVSVSASVVSVSGSAVVSPVWGVSGTSGVSEPARPARAAAAAAELLDVDVDVDGIIALETKSRRRRRRRFGVWAGVVIGARFATSGTRLWGSERRSVVADVGSGREMRRERDSGIEGCILDGGCECG